MVYLTELKNIVRLAYSLTFDAEKLQNNKTTSMNGDFNILLFKLREILIFKLRKKHFFKKQR